MNCRDCQELLQGLLDGDLPGAAKAEFEGHLAECPDCRDLNAAAVRLKEGLRWFVPAKPPPIHMGQATTQIGFTSQTLMEKVWGKAGNRHGISFEWQALMS